MCRYLSFIYWAYSLLLKIQFRGKMYFDCSLTAARLTNDDPNHIGCTRITDLRSELGFPRDLEGTPLVEVGVLVAMVLLLRYAVFLVLVWKTRKV
jgi:hypothetical protein